MIIICVLTYDMTPGFINHLQISYNGQFHPVIVLNIVNIVFLHCAGRFTAHDIAVFVKESASSSVQTLGPEDFPAKVSQPDVPFFVDFFAPVRHHWLVLITCIASFQLHYSICSLSTLRG